MCSKKMEEETNEFHAMEFSWIDIDQIHMGLSDLNGFLKWVWSDTHMASMNEPYETYQTILVAYKA